MHTGFSSFIGLVLVGGARFAAHKRYITLVLVRAVVANFTLSGGGLEFFSNWAKLAIGEWIVLGKISAVVYNVPAHARHTRGICNSVGTLVFSSVANGAFCGGRDILFTGGAMFAIVVLPSILAVVYNVASRVTRHTNGICNSAGLLVFSSVANGAFCGGRDIFFARGTTFAIVRRVVFGFSKAIV
jgi:hypothetical protein